MDLPPALPHKWDLADKVPEGMNIREILVNAVELKLIKTTMQPNLQALTQTQQKEKSIVDYLEAQLTSRNHSFWMDAKTEDLIRSNMAENPHEALKNWQYITNSYSHSFIPMTFEEMRLKTQEANILLDS